MHDGNGDRSSLSQQVRELRSQVEELERELESRMVIGQAEGILMERLGIDSRQAIDRIRLASYELGRKLDVATEIVVTREVPDVSWP
ncbi:ANTAR domain-containing protein [Nocardioides KLBMP 9356]|uniref:ANTAR domain-containing protein n=1 Tax=Nocardioides potassii TaxID=2911371 RepID=A0ABS9HDV3_9ACTN|nr:ANTAR domain-containing protein [Nocardioides potassii]MCF6379316.1 ANTAR domain-containing protein [Nocardioides potassii]